jgi:tetratricopeptide (TPR) repeat protein
MGKYKVPYILLLIFIIAMQCSGQVNLNAIIQKADSLTRNKKFGEAEELYKKVIKDEPNNHLAVYRLAALYYSEGKYDDAINNYLILAPNKNPTVLYNLACIYSLTDNKTEALKYLEEAVNNGFNQLSAVRTDNDLNNIRNEKKFEEIVKSIESPDNFPEAKKFDFWVGEWDVYNPQNQKSGDSKIEKILKDAVILENWTGVNGYTGKSFNHYDMDKKKWIQYWIDENSSSIYFEGNYDSTKNAIVFYSYDHAKDKSPYVRRLTFFNLAPDTVRQFSQRTTDEGKTWSIEYDFNYVRKNGSN